MATNVNVDGFQDSRYFARSWALANMGNNLGVTVLKLGLVSLIPIVGPIIALGFVVEWARQVAWGVSCPPGSRPWSWGDYLRSGWRAIVVMLGYSLIVGIASGILSSIPLIGSFLQQVISLLGVVIAVVVMVAVMHAAIYQRIGAGFNFSRVFRLVDHDAIGLARVLGFTLLTGFVLALVYGTLTVGIALPGLVSMVGELGGLNGIEYNRALFDVLIKFLLNMLPGALVSYVINCFAGTLVSIVAYGMMGLWLRQFDVPNWGMEDDPLPPTINAQQPTYAPYTQVPTAPGGAGTYQQPDFGYGQAQQPYAQTQAQPQAQQQAYVAPTWQEMDAQAQQLWQQQYETAARQAAAQQAAEQQVAAQQVAAQQPAFAPAPEPMVASEDTLVASFDQVAPAQGAAAPAQGAAAAQSLPDTVVELPFDGDSLEDSIEP